MRTLIGMSLLIFLSCIALACADGPKFDLNYGAWKAFPKGMKFTYIAGAFDMLMTSGSQDPYDQADQRAIGNCTTATGMTPEILSELVDRRYEQHTEEWAFGPANVLVAALIDACKTQINDERRNRKLDAIN